MMIRFTSSSVKRERSLISLTTPLCHASLACVRWGTVWRKHNVEGGWIRAIPPTAIIQLHTCTDTTFIQMQWKGIHASMFVHVNIGAQMWSILCVCVCAYIDCMMVFICHTEVREVCYLSERFKGFCFKDTFFNAERLKFLSLLSKYSRSSVELRGSWKCTLHTKHTHSSQFLQRGQYYLEKIILWVHPGIFEPIIENAMWLDLQEN